MSKPKVVITGVGAIAPNGNNIESFWSALVAGKSGIDTIKSYDTKDHSVTIAGEIKNFNYEDYIDRKTVRKLDRFSIFALVAAEEAIKNANLESSTLGPDRIGVILGSGVGGVATLVEQQNVLQDKGPKWVSPHFVPKMIANIAAGHIAIRWNLKGPNQTIVSACASGTDAIGIALRLIQVGDADAIVTGGSEASVLPLTIAGFANMRALSTRNDDPQAASRPFDLDRDGFILSEGSGILIIETEKRALARNAPILAELAGYGATDDAYHVTQPSEGGAGGAKAMQRAIANAGLNPKDISYINAHGTSTPYNDKNESKAIRAVFGEYADKLKVSSTKSMTGHLLGASGAVEAIASVKAIQQQIAPPTINYQTPDPECALDYIPNKAQSFEINSVMSNSFGFGGHNGVLVFKKYRNNT
ncbi:MAG: beta-ketoacyl-ACP synthase II [Candidatus Marinimicrobia bacterium]|nr:beta-ketoacyl-ACP synthase II [Candidatus Neomarinimicrobiota bacterium]